MRRYKVHGLRQMRGHITHDCALHRTDIGNDGTGSEVRANLPCDGTTCADGDAYDDEIGALSRRGIGLYVLIGKTELGDAPARLRGPCRGYDRAYRALRTCRARDRGADQSDADQGQAIEQGGRFAHAGFPRNSLSACTTSRLASSVPTLIRSAFGSL